MLLRKIAALFNFKPKKPSVDIPEVVPQLVFDLPQQNLINLDFLREMAMGDEDFVVEIMNMFIEQTPTNIQKLMEFTCNKQWKELKELAHKMKSAVVMIGIKELEDIFINLQVYVATPDKNALIQPMVMRAEQLCQIAIKDLKSELKQLENQHA